MRGKIHTESKKALQTKQVSMLNWQYYGDQICEDDV